MLLAVGTTVKLSYTGDLARVSALLSETLVEVEILESGEKIPVFADDLERVDNQKAPGKVVKVATPQDALTPTRPADGQYHIFKSLGIQLAFAPVTSSNGETKSYEVYLINDTPFPIVYDITLSQRDGHTERYQGKLETPAYENIGLIVYDQLNEGLVYDFLVNRLTTMGIEGEFEKKLKIKPQQFFNKVRTAPLLNRQVHLYRVIEKVGEEKEVKKTEDLAAYTKRNSTPKSNFIETNIKPLENRAESLSHFPLELDLHYEALKVDREKVRPNQVLDLQLKVFENYLDEALRLGVDRVFIVHGVGKGKLRSLIATKLFQHPYVKTFKNEHHPKYGWGATEVIFD